CSRMVGIVRVVVGVRQNDVRAARAVFLDECLDERIRAAKRIVTSIEEANLGTKDAGGSFRFSAPDFLRALDRHARFLPRPLALAALAVGQAQNADARAA